MITIKKDKCIPQKLKIGEIPDYICSPNGNKYYLSREEKKDYIYGGKCPEICPLNVKSDCPDVSFVSDTTVARQQCEANLNCQFIGNQVINREGPNYCIPKNQPGCINLTESDYAKSDKILTDNPLVCDRLGRGCVFNRGTSDGLTGRKGNPVCLRGCLGSKYWKNPKYMWGGGGTSEDPYDGSWFNSDLEVGPKYIEAAPSPNNPKGWGGPLGSPFFGFGKLPRSLGIPYTESRGKYSPPCNLEEGDIGVFTSAVTGESLAGPGCRLTAPQPRYGMKDWSYTCKCPYLGEGGEFKSDAWSPCQDYELDQENIQDRDVCEGCYILNDKKNELHGHCVLGETTADTESKILGCIEEPSNPGKCRVKRFVEPTECPHFCSNKPSDPSEWRKNTQCSQQLAKGCWKLNPKFKKVISLGSREEGKQAPPFIKTSIPCNVVKDTDYLCRNCAQTSIKTIGSGTKYPNRSYCVVGGSESSGALNETAYGDYLARKLSCPATCKQCLTGFFGEPMKPIYNLDEADNPSSAFNKGILFVPWVGTQAVKDLQTSKKLFS
jgi:hypothetical protein